MSIPTEIEYYNTCTKPLWVSQGRGEEVRQKRDQTSRYVINFYD